MELSWRTALILLGLTIIIGVIIDGIRRMNKARNEAIRLDKQTEFHFSDDNPEISGPARVLNRQNETAAATPAQTIAVENSYSDVSVDFEEPEQADSLSPVVVKNTLTDDDPIDESELEALDKEVAALEEHITSAALEEALATHPSMEEELQVNPSPLPIYPVNFASPEAEKLSDRPKPELVLVIHAIARPNKEFSGKDIVYLFNSCDLRFGEKNIFHRFDQADGKGHVQFSVVHSYEPQSFNPMNIATQSFRGLSFFMKLPGVGKPVEAFDAMVGMAMVLSKQFDAELFDGERSALTQQTIEHDRQQIIEYERRKQLQAKKNAR
ncbi:MAG: cell division protein ZipA [Venatoribacter sp.]